MGKKFYLQMDISVKAAAPKRLPESFPSTDRGKELEIWFRKIFFYGAIVRLHSDISIFTVLMVGSRLERKCCLDGELVVVGESLWNS